MSDNCREILRDMAGLIVALALGLTAAWVVLRSQQPEPAANAVERARSRP